MLCPKNARLETPFASEFIAEETVLPFDEELKVILASGFSDELLIPIFKDCKVTAISLLSVKSIPTPSTISKSFKCLFCIQPEKRNRHKAIDIKLLISFDKFITIIFLFKH